MAPALAGGYEPAGCFVMVQPVIRRLSTISIYPLTALPVFVSFCGIGSQGVDNMLDQLDPPVSTQDDTETLSENVFRRIQAAIVKGEIAPGSKISEPELARTYGISRGPLREAIHRLEGQRLLVRVPHVGARVVSLNHAELLELYEIRESLEGMACRLAAERMSVEEIDELRRVLETHERDAAFQAGVGYYQQEGDFDFHYRIIQGSGNRTLRSEEHTSELQSHVNLVCRLLLEKKKK